MQPIDNKRYYTPQFSALAAISVRRLAWALNKSMPAAVDVIIQLLPLVLNSSKVCSACKDKTKCQSCCFNNLTIPPDVETLEPVI